MPFKNPLQPYNRDTVLGLKQDQTGVYGLFRSGKCIYVGKGKIRQRLLDHLNGDNACITRSSPTHWTAELWSNPDDREKQLILELNPGCNDRIG